MPALNWEELELPVLQWVHAATPGGSGYVETGHIARGDQTTEAVPGLTAAQLDEALKRLKEHGLIAGHDEGTPHLVHWWDLRPTADGLRVLGEWPPAEAASVNDALAAVLRQLATELPEEDATAARRAGSALARMSAGAVRDVIRDEAKRLGEEATT